MRYGVLKNAWVTWVCSLSSSEKDALYAGPAELCLFSLTPAHPMRIKPPTLGPGAQCLEDILGEDTTLPYIMVIVDRGHPRRAMGQ